MFRRFRRRDDDRDRRREPSPEAAGEERGDDVTERLSQLSQALGGAPPDEARIAAVERLTELRAEGKVSEENYRRERRRLMGEG